MMPVNRKKDKWGCFYDLKIEALEETRQEEHLINHESYPQSWCEWCEEEEEGKKHKEDKVGGIVNTIRKLRRGKNAKIL